MIDIVFKKFCEFYPFFIYKFSQLIYNKFVKKYVLYTTYIIKKVKIGNTKKKFWR